MSPSTKRARRSSSLASSRRRRHAQHSRGTIVGAAVDWFVPIPTTIRGKTSETETRLWVSHALHRAHEELGYTHIALTHTVYGRPQHPIDAATVALPASLWQASQQQHQQPNRGNVQVLRRLHIVVESLSDTGLYTNPQPSSPLQKLLQDYDLVSLQPRNEVCFQAVCRSSGVNPAFDIVTVDNDTSNVPMKSADLQALWQNKNSVALELCYAPAILAITPHARRRWIQTCRAVYQAASTSTSSSTMTRLLLSSGPGLGTTSTTTTTTTTTLASSLPSLPILRSPADMVNILTTVCGWHERVARAANTTVGTMVWERAQQRRSKSVSINNNPRAGGATGVRVQSVTLVDVDDDGDSNLWTAPTKTKTTTSRDKIHPTKIDQRATITTPIDMAVLVEDKNPLSSGEVQVNQAKEDDGNDGYIAF